MFKVVQDNGESNEYGGKRQVLPKSAQRDSG